MKIKKATKNRAALAIIIVMLLLIIIGYCFLLVRQAEDNKQERELAETVCKNSCERLDSLYFKLVQPGEWRGCVCVNAEGKHYSVW